MLTEQFLGMLLGTLGASLLGNLLTGKRSIATSQDWGTIRAAEGTIRAGKETKIFNAALSFNKFWNTKVLSKWTKI